MDRRKRRGGKSQRRERVGRKKTQERRKVTIPMFCDSGGSKSRRTAGGEPSAQIRDEKLHAVAAQEVKNTSVSEHFWKFRCRKSARRCGTKMREARFEVKMIKHTIV